MSEEWSPYPPHIVLEDAFKLGLEWQYVWSEVFSLPVAMLWSQRNQHGVWLKRPHTPFGRNLIMWTEWLQRERAF